MSNAHLAHKKAHVLEEEADALRARVRKLETALLLDFDKSAFDELKGSKEALQKDFEARGVHIEQLYALLQSARDALAVQRPELALATLEAALPAMTPATAKDLEESPMPFDGPPPTKLQLAERAWEAAATELGAASQTADQARYNEAFDAAAKAKAALKAAREELQ